MTLSLKVFLCVWWGDFPPFHNPPVFDYLLPALLPFIFTSVFVCISTIIWLKEELFYVEHVNVGRVQSVPVGLEVSMWRVLQVSRSCHLSTHSPIEGKKFDRNSCSQGAWRRVYSGTLLPAKINRWNSSLCGFCLSTGSPFFGTAALGRVVSLSFLQLGVGVIEKFRFVCKPLIFFQYDYNYLLKERVTTILLTSCINQLPLRLLRCIILYRFQSGTGRNVAFHQRERRWLLSHRTGRLVRRFTRHFFLSTANRTDLLDGVTERNRGHYAFFKWLFSCQKCSWSTVELDRPSWGYCRSGQARVLRASGYLWRCLLSWDDQLYAFSKLIMG